MNSKPVLWSISKFQILIGLVEIKIGRCECWVASGEDNGWWHWSWNLKDEREVDSKGMRKTIQAEGREAAEIMRWEQTCHLWRTVSRPVWLGVINEGEHERSQRWVGLIMRELVRSLHFTECDGNMEVLTGGTIWLGLDFRRKALGTGWRAECWARREGGRIVKSLVVVLMRAPVVGILRDDWMQICFGGSEARDFR